MPGWTIFAWVLLLLGDQLVLRHRPHLYAAWALFRLGPPHPLSVPAAIERGETSSYRRMAPPRLATLKPLAPPDGVELAADRLVPARKGRSALLISRRHARYDHVLPGLVRFDAEAGADHHSVVLRARYGLPPLTLLVFVLATLTLVARRGWYPPAIVVEVALLVVAILGYLRLRRALPWAFTLLDEAQQPDSALPSSEP